MKQAEARAPKNWNHHPHIILAALVGHLLAVPACAQEDTNDIPRIRPLHAALPPTFWEQHGKSVIILGSVLLVVILGLIIWWFTRPKPVVALMAETIAREALMALPAALEEDARLSRVTLIFRQYIRQRFGFPKSEQTTRELCNIIAGHSQIGPELAGELTDFFRESDWRKFAPVAGKAVSVNVVTVVLSLIEKCETRPGGQRAAPVTAPANPTGGTA